MRILGVDCSTDPKKTGLALAELGDDGILHVEKCRTGSKKEAPHEIAIGWLDGCENVIFAMDAPLGWPELLAKHLAPHQAGEPLNVDSNKLFRRLTDDEIHRRLGKRPLDVAADRIARTALSALVFLEEIRESSGQPIPMFWGSKSLVGWGVIEVYPAATRVAYRAPNRLPASFNGLLKPPPNFNLKTASEHELDAMICALGAADFLRGLAVSPTEGQQKQAAIEGWIWAHA